MKLAECFSHFEINFTSYVESLTAEQRRNAALTSFRESAAIVKDTFAKILSVEKTMQSECKPGTRLSAAQKISVARKLNSEGVINLSIFFVTSVVDHIATAINIVKQACENFDEQDEEVKTFILSVIVPFLREASNSDPAVLETVVKEEVAAKQRVELRALAARLEAKAVVEPVAVGGAVAAAGGGGGGSSREVRPLSDSEDSDPRVRVASVSPGLSDPTRSPSDSDASDPRSNDSVASGVKTPDPAGQTLVFDRLISREEMRGVDELFRDTTVDKRRALATYSQQNSLPGGGIRLTNKADVLELLFVLRNIYRFVQDFDIEKFKAELSDKLPGASTGQKLFFLDYMRAYAAVGLSNNTFMLLECLKMYAQLFQELAVLVADFSREEYGKFSAEDAAEIMAVFESDHESSAAVLGWVSGHSIAACPLVRDLEAYRAELVVKFGSDPGKGTRVTPADFAREASAEVTRHYARLEAEAVATAKVSGNPSGLFAVKVGVTGRAADLVAEALDSHFTF